jgi:Phosphodiester glycosidase
MRFLPQILIALLLWTGPGFSSQAPAWLSPSEVVAPGIEYFTSTDASLVDPPGPIAVYLLKLDPSRARLESMLSNDEVFGAEPVQPIAQRHHAVAAVNAGFFNTRNGEPIGLLKVHGELVSDTPFTKGAVAIRSPARGKTELEFDQISARVSMSFTTAGKTRVVPIDGVDTTRERGKMMLYTPAYHADTDTAANGTEWVLQGRPAKVREVRRDQGHTPIPRDGSVLSFGGLDLPDPLAALLPGVEVKFAITWRTLNGLSAKHLDAADHIVNGNGLLRVKGRALTDWQVERFSGPDFTGMRHPRTLVGVDRRGVIWLAAIDGRQPEHSVGMNFAELERLCDRLQLTDALNLDGGGSTTMVVKDQIVNKPSDVTGPRPVSDAILVFGR